MNPATVRAFIGAFALALAWTHAAVAATLAAKAKEAGCTNRPTLVEGRLYKCMTPAGIAYFAVENRAPQRDYSVEGLAFDKCEFREVVGRLQYASIEKAADIAKETMPVLGKQRAIIAKAPNPTKPTGEQLTPQDVETLGALGQRSQTLQAMSLLESRRERDLRVLLDWGQQIDSFIRWDSTPSEGTLQFKEWSAFMLGRLALDSKLSISTPKQPKCSLELAIHRIEDEYITRLNKLPIDDAQAKFKMLQSKYGGGKINRDKLSPEDRAVLDSVHANVLGPADKLDESIQHYEMLKILAAMSEQIYVSDSADLTQSAGDLTSIGQTIANAASSNALSEQQTIAIGIWHMLDEQVPSELAKAYKELAQRLEAAKRPTQK